MNFVLVRQERSTKLAENKQKSSEILNAQEYIVNFTFLTIYVSQKLLMNKGKNTKTSTGTMCYLTRHAAGISSGS